MKPGRASCPHPRTASSRPRTRPRAPPATRSPLRSPRAGRVRPRGISSSTAASFAGSSISVLVDRREDGARRDVHHADAARRELPRDRLREQLQAALRRAVVAEAPATGSPRARSTRSRSRPGRPPPASRARPRASRGTPPVRFTAITLFHSSSGMSTSANGFSIPALFTSRSTGPPSSARRPLEHRHDLLLVRHVGGDRERAAAGRVDLAHRAVGRLARRPRS